MSKEQIFGTPRSITQFEHRLAELIKPMHRLRLLYQDDIKEFDPITKAYRRYTPSERLTLIRKEAYAILAIADDIEAKELIETITKEHKGAMDILSGTKEGK